MWDSLSNVKILYIKLFQFIFLTFFHIQHIFFHILNNLHIFFTLYSFFLWITHFFIHSIIHSIMRCKYSFKEFIHSKILANYSFNKFIHSKKSEIIHSMKIFIHLKNGLSPTPTVIPGPVIIFPRHKFSVVPGGGMVWPRYRTAAQLHEVNQPWLHSRPPSPSPWTWTFTWTRWPWAEVARGGEQVHRCQEILIVLCHLAPPPITGQTTNYLKLKICFCNQQ